MPATATAGATYARFRLSENPGLTYQGFGGKGEVEDCPATIASAASITFSGLQHVSLGGAMLDVNSNGLQIANLGTNGTDGVRINLGRVNAWRAALTHQLGASSCDGCAHIEWLVNGERNGVADQPVIRGWLERTQDCLALYADGSLMGATQFNVELLSNSVVVARSTVNSGRLGRLRATLAGVLQHFEIDWEGLRGPNDGGCYLRWAGDQGDIACDYIFDDGTVVGADTVRFLAANPAASMGTFSRVELRGLNSGDFTLQNELVGLLGYWQRGVGDAVLDTGDTNVAPTLRAHTLGDSGAGGFETIVGGPEYVSAPDSLLRQRMVQAWPDDWEMPWLTSSNSQVSWTATGRVTASVNSFVSLSDLSALRQGQGTALSIRFDELVATQFLLEIFDGPALVGSLTLPVAPWAR